MSDQHVRTAVGALAIAVRATRPGFLVITGLGSLPGFAHALAGAVPRQWRVALPNSGGALLGWAYSHPPLMLMSRGLGELAVGAGWWLLVLGSDRVLRGGLARDALAVGASDVALLAAILLVDEFPDRAADAAVGKRTAVVRLDEARAWSLAVLLMGGAHLWVAFCA